MTIKEGFKVVYTTMKTLGSKAISAIANASIGSLIKVGVLTGTIVVSVYLAVKKLRDKMRAIRHIKNGTRHPNDKAAAADVGTDTQYDSVRAHMRDKAKGTYDQSLLRKSKYWKTLTKKERAELERLERAVGESILGDDYDPDEDYFDIGVVRMCHDMEDVAKERQEEVDWLNRTRLSDDYCIWKSWHGPRLA